MEILTKTVETMTMNSAMRSSLTLSAARNGSTNVKCRPSPKCTAPRTRPITTTSVNCKITTPLA